MALTVTQRAYGFFDASDAEMISTPTSGTWLVATVVTKAVDNSNPQVSVGDWARNCWQLVYSGKVQASATNTAAQLMAQVWVAPAIQYPGWSNLGVYASMLYGSTSDVAHGVVDVFEVAGMSNGYLTVDSVTVATASGATSLSITMPAPAGGANCLMVACAGVDSDSHTASTTLTSAGWTQMTSPTNYNPNVIVVPGWHEGTTGQTVTWTSSVSTNWAAVAVAIRTSGVGPTQLSPNWPAVEFQLGLGQNLATPINAVRWTTLPNRLMQFDTQRGIQYELGFVQSSPTDLTLRNDDGVLSPRAGGSGTAVANGTTTTLVVSNSDGATVTVGDFFQLKNGGSLKEVNVFQVTAVSAATNTTITYVRADGTGGGSAINTATGDVYSACPIDVFLPYRIMASWNGVKYPVSVGWIERWPQVWNDPHWGVVNAVGIDVIATLTAADQTMIRGEILRRNPTAYWPCNDLVNASQATNYGSTSVPLVVTTMTPGGGAQGSGQFGASVQRVPYTASANITRYTSLIGDPGTSWKSTGMTVAETNASKGFALVSTPGNNTTFPSIAGGVTIVLAFFLDQTWFNASQTTTTLTYDPTLLIVRSSVGTGPAATSIRVSWDGPSTDANWEAYKVTVWDKTTLAATTTVGTNTGTNPTAVNGFSWLFVALAFNQTSWTIYTGDIGNTPNSFSGSANVISNFGLLDVGGEADSTTNGYCCPGQYAHIAVFNRKWTLGEVTDFSQACNPGQPINSATNDYIRRKLGFVRWNGSTVLNSTTYHMGTDYPATTIAEKVATLADSEGGFAFADAYGQLQFRGKDRAAAQVTRATLGDNPSGGEIPYVGGSGDLEFDFDSTYIYNAVSVTDTGVSNADSAGFTNYETFTVQDNTSIARYGLRTLGKTSALANTSNGSALASALLTKYAYPKARVSTVKIDVFKASQWAFALGVEVGDVVVVNRRPIGAPAISVTCVVLSVKHDVDPLVKWEMTLILAPR